MENRSYNKNSLNSRNLYVNNPSLTKNPFDKKIKTLVITFLIIFLIIIIIYLIICLIHYFNCECYEKKNFFSYMFDFNDSNVCVHITNPNDTPKKEPLNILPFIEKKEVFHLENQDYTYEQSKCKCESYGGKLATKSQVIDAYNKGANWCSYGWSEGQNAFYPVQKCYWDEMEEKNRHLPKHARQFCGMPGVNGGYFANPSIKFGINCYGVKPAGQTSKEKKPYCPPMNFCKLEQNYEASHRLESDEIAPFNTDSWNMN